MFLINEHATYVAMYVQLSMCINQKHMCYDFSSMNSYSIISMAHSASSLHVVGGLYTMHADLAHMFLAIYKIGGA